MIWNRTDIMKVGTKTLYEHKFSRILSFVSFYCNGYKTICNREGNLKSLEAEIQKLDKPIEYHGLHYIGAQKYPSQMISEEEFEACWTKLAVEPKELN